MIKTVCVVCGLPDGPPDGEVVETVCGDSDCISLFEGPITKHIVRGLFDKAARRSIYLSNVEEDDAVEFEKALIRYQRAQRRAIYAMIEEGRDDD
jgi:hypothetical protein